MRMLRTQERVQLDLPADSSAPGVARRALRALLDPGRLCDGLDVVLLVASELVTNAVRHGAPPVRLSVRVGRQGVTIAVHDGSSRVPSVRSADGAAESGRGLTIVDRLATGTGQRSFGSGKVVWAHFALEPDAPPPDAGLGDGR